MRRKVELSDVFRLLPVGAIVFQAGISGAWWAEQFRAPLPGLWGWFGAALVGVGMWAGVEIVVRGERRGWLLVGVTGTADSVMAWSYFDHAAPGVGAALAVAPALLTVLAGWEGAIIGEMRRREASAAREVEIDEELAERRREAAHRRRLETLRVQAEVSGRDRTGAVSDGQVSGHDRTVSGGDGEVSGQVSGRELALAWLGEREGGVSVGEMGRFGGSERTHRRWLAAAGWHANGDGLWHRDLAPVAARHLEREL
jgi:hypothetical protein